MTEKNKADKANKPVIECGKDDAMLDSDTLNAAIGTMVGTYTVPPGATSLSTASSNVRTGLIVIANGSVGMIPPANAMAYCGGHTGGSEKARAALRKPDTACSAKSANQAFPAVNGGASIQPSLDGTGACVIGGGANYNSVGVYQMFGYQAPPMGAGHQPNGKPLALHLTPVALTGLVRAASGLPLSAGMASALVPLAVWAAKSGCILPTTGA